MMHQVFTSENPGYDGLRRNDYVITAFYLLFNRIWSFLKRTIK